MADNIKVRGQAVFLALACSRLSVLFLLEFAELLNRMLAAETAEVDLNLDSCNFVASVLLFADQLRSFGDSIENSNV